MYLERKGEGRGVRRTVGRSLVKVLLFEQGGRASGVGGEETWYWGGGGRVGAARQQTSVRLLSSR